MSRRGAPIFILPLLIVLSVAATLPDGPFHFVDSSTEAGMTTPIVYGNGKTQRYILETRARVSQSSILTTTGGPMSFW